MSILDRFRKKQPEPPKISASYGYTTEWARQAAVRNMQDYPAVKQRVLNLLIEQTGSPEKGQEEFNRRFPELS